MTAFICPTCRRQFEQAGFCVFDGARLANADIVDKETQVSVKMSAQQPVTGLDIDQHPTELDPPKSTLPLTPTPAPPAAAPQAIVLESAAEDPTTVLQTLKKRESEYDKLVGQTLDGRYFVEKKIGEGGMGVVFSARHAVIERPLAIKVLKREVMRDTATIRRFVQEAKAASRIGHPNIVDVTDFGTTPDGMTYSVMEFVTGKTLGAALREGAPFPVARVLRIAAQIARALGAAHDKGIVHRDLKPENVFLVDRDGRPDFVKIVDFGIAKVTPAGGAAAGEPRLTRAGSVFGTPEYMAPEQAAGKSDTDQRVDVYALGVIIYEMLCGRVPHRGDSMVRTLAMQMLDPAEPPSRVRPDLDIPRDLEAVVMRALAKKREQRFQSMGELVDALERTLPPPIGASVTGSPVYELPAVPPGADPIAAAGVRMPQRSAELAQAFPEQSVPPPAIPAILDTPPPRRIRDEPEFTGHDKPQTFDHVWTSELPKPPARRWPILLLLVAIGGGAAGAIAFVAHRRSVVTEAPHDAAVVIAQRPDAAVIVDVPIDAAIDAPELVVLVEPDAGVRRVHDAGPRIVETPNRRGTYMVQVLTKPEGADLYVGTTFRGPGGTNIEETPGTELTITCKLKGYKPGKVHVTFDGNTSAVLCTLERIKICIDGIKNPFDDCP